MEFTRKILGRSEIINERVKKSRETKSVKTETIVRTTRACIVLDCGHKIPLTRFNKVPAKSTHCYDCEMGPGVWDMEDKAASLPIRKD